MNVQTKCGTAVLREPTDGEHVRVCAQHGERYAVTISGGKVTGVRQDGKTKS